MELLHSYSGVFPSASLSVLSDIAFIVDDCRAKTLVQKLGLQMCENCTLKHSTYPINILTLLYVEFVQVSNTKIRVVSTKQKKQTNNWTEDFNNVNVNGRTRIKCNIIKWKRSREMNKKNKEEGRKLKGVCYK